MSDEIWKPVVGFPDYEVSNLGRVRSLGVFKRGRMYPAKFLKQDIAKGYCRVTLSNRKRFMVHRLVAFAFLANECGKRYVNHINGNKLDNRQINLEFATASENCLHSTRVLGEGVGEKHGMSKLTNEQAKEIKTSSLRTCQLADAYDVSYETIRLIKHGKTWRHI